MLTSPRIENYREPSQGSVTSTVPIQQLQPQSQDPPRLLNPPSPTFPKRISYATAVQQPAFGPVLESVDHAVKTTDLGDVRLPGPMTTDDFTRAVAVATVSALRHQQQSASHNPMRMRNPENEAIVGGGQKASQGGGQGGHDAPSWSRTTSASVLLGCTALYAIIAGEYPSFHLIILGSLTNGWLLTELLVDVVDIVLKDSEIDEKFLGVTLFALVPNTTEFMNAISFALNGNIALRYAL